MVYYEPVKIEYTDEQLLRINNFLDKYNNYLEFKKAFDNILERMKNEQANKTFRRRSDKKNKRK